MKKFLLFFGFAFFAIGLNAQNYNYTRSYSSSSYYSTQNYQPRDSYLSTFVKQRTKNYVNSPNNYVNTRTVYTYPNYQNPTYKPVKYYTNTYGEKVQSPTYYKTTPSGARALCKDGTYSFSRTSRGTCSHHGGVARWLY